MSAAVEYTILDVEPGYSGTVRDGGSEVKRIHFLINSTTNMAMLPDCLPGSTAGDWKYYATPTDATAIFRIKDNDGTWKPE
jgi:hypothetical protein